MKMPTEPSHSSGWHFFVLGIRFEDSNPACPPAPPVDLHIPIVTPSFDPYIFNITSLALSDSSWRHPFPPEIFNLCTLAATKSSKKYTTSFYDTTFGPNFHEKEINRAEELPNSGHFGYNIPKYGNNAAVQLHAVYFSASFRFAEGHNSRFSDETERKMAAPVRYGSAAK